MAFAGEFDEGGNPIEPDPFQFLPPEFDPNQVRRRANPDNIPTEPDVTNRTGQSTPGPNNSSPAPSRPAGTFNRQQFQDAWMSSAPGTDIQRFINDHPEFATGVTVNRDRGTFPNGEVIDLMTDFGPGGRNMPAWNGTGFNSSGVPDSPGAQPGAGVPASPSTMPSPAFASAGASSNPGIAVNPFGEIIHKMIMEMLRRSSAPVTEEDVKGQFAPVDRQMQLAATKAKTAAAERAAFQGVNMGGAGGPLDFAQKSIDENLGASEGGLMAKLIQDELAARRGELQNAMQLATGEEKVALTLQLNALDNEIRKQGLEIQRNQVSNQNNQFFSQLGQQNNQFYDQFGLDSALQEFFINQNINQGLTG